MISYKQAINALCYMELKQTRWLTLPDGKIVTRRDCQEAIDRNNLLSPESFIEQARRDI